MTTYLPSHKPFKEDEQGMWATAGEVRTNSQVTFSNGLLHMDAPASTDQQRHQRYADTGFKNWQGVMKDSDGWWVGVIELSADNDNGFKYSHWKVIFKHIYFLPWVRVELGVMTTKIWRYTSKSYETGDSDAVYCHAKDICSWY